MCSNKLLDKKITVSPTAEPVTLDDVKLWASIDFNEKDNVLTGLITAARQLLEEKYDIGIVRKTVTAIVDNSCGGIEVPGAPIGTVTGKNQEGNSVELTIIGLDHKFIESPCSCYLELEYESGYEAADIPEVFRTAIKQQVLWMFEHLGDENFDDTKVSPMAAMSLKPFRRNGTGVYI
ncbi:Phage gp6-like head-tail connector protein [Chitinophaga eiseniae]|uniref:Phage gp6-like head-tail connector protein n=1 Tax=Chitinophaga eiseniae TaxID=634771 RepID=A0A1T4SNR7_9BACT|nr:phage head-tail connector protein [Chitinophaga eiseniae]SKA29797.1 Phage gp6-like head-tail connector protein [Chitinophaga eiseniae]